MVWGITVCEIRRLINVVTTEDECDLFTETLPLFFKTLVKAGTEKW